MLTSPLFFIVSVCVCAAWDRPDHERPGGRGEGPAAAAVPSHPRPTSTSSQLQITLRQQRTPAEPFNGRQGPSRRSGGRVPLQEVRQVSDIDSLTHSCPDVTCRACAGSTGVWISKQRQVSCGVCLKESNCPVTL